MSKKTIEQQTADTVLQRDEEFVCDGEVFRVSPPCLETLIVASEYISLLPAMSVSYDPDKAFYEALFLAKECRALGDICAVLILGAKNLVETRKSFFGLRTETINRKDILARKLRINYTPSELHKMMKDRLEKMEVSAFFALSTSLIEINLLQQTREVEKMTASGQ